MRVFEWLGKFLNGETEFPCLAKYIEVEIVRTIDPGQNVAAAVGLSAATLGALIGVGLGIVFNSIALGAIVFAGGLAFGLNWFLRYQKRQSESQKELNRARRQAREFLHELRKWKFLRMLEMKLTGGMGEILDAAAASWLRAHLAVNSANEDAKHRHSSLGATAENVMAAMDSGMAKLLIMAKEAQEYGSAFLSPNFDNARHVANEMRELSKETERLCDRLQIERSAGPTPIDELRDALAEIKHLDAAEQEVNNLRIGR
ncbi:MAG: hypothetical protein ACR2HJ_04355 [Fimbriimonadales bacterium]